MHLDRVRGGVFARLLVASALAFAVLLIARPAHAANASVTISNFQFAPAAVTINAGDTVTWTNSTSDTTHTVTSDTGAFSSGNITPGNTFQFTFTTAGTYTYHCSIHPTMTGSVVVQQTGGTPSATATSSATTTATTTTTVTSTPTSAATATMTPTTVPPTATSAPPTATATRTSTPVTAVASATVVPLPPNTGQSAGGGSSKTPIYLGLASLLVLIGGGTAIGAWVSRRR